MKSTWIKSYQDLSKFPNIDQTLLVGDGIINSTTIKKETSAIWNSEFNITLKNIWSLKMFSV